MSRAAAEAAAAAGFQSNIAFPIHHRLEAVNLAAAGAIPSHRIAQSCVK